MSISLENAPYNLDKKLWENLIPYPLPYSSLLLQLCLEYI